MAKVLSIEISNSLIRIVEMDYKKKNPTVYRHTVVSTPQGSISDGYLSGSTELKEVIRRMLAEHKMTTTKDVIFTVASSKIITREVLLPAVKPNMIGSMIRTNLNEYFPIDLSSYEIAHQVLEQITEGADAGKYRTLVMAAEKSLVESYDALARDCGLRLVSLDYAGNSIFQAIRKEDTASRVMVLKIEESQTTLSIIKNKNLMLQRNINYGLSDVIQETMKQGIFNVPDYDSAWDLLKRKTCIKFSITENAQRNLFERDLSTDLETRDYDESQEIREAKIEITKSLESFINAVRRVVEFYSSRNSGEAIDRVLITGFGGGMSGLSKLLTNELGIKTTVVNRLEGVNYYVSNSDEGIFNYISCIGATFNPVGFISKEKKAKEKKETDYTFTIVLTIIAVIVACVAMTVISIMGYNDAKNQEKQLQEREALYLKSEKTYIAYTNTLKLFELVEAGDKKTLRPNDNILNFLSELERTLPQDVVVTQFKSDDTEVVMSMEVADKETAAGVIANMREFDSIMSVTVASIAEVRETDEEGAAEETSYVTFTITAIYYPVGVSAE